MIALIAHYWFGLAVAVLIGLVTAWWTWGRQRVLALDLVEEAAPLAWPPRDAASDAEIPPSETPAWMRDYEARTDAVGPQAATVAPDVPAPDLPADVPVPPARMAAGPPDDLMLIKGIGPQIDALLRSLGVNRFEQIAAWMPEDIERVDASLGEFKGRIIRDEWIAQARLLAAGDMATFNQRYGHL